MIVFPASKINIGLRVRYKRPDGFHELESLMVPVPFLDILEIIPASYGKDHFIQTGIALEGNSSANLVVKAVELFRTHYPIPALRIHLHKVIPAGAGLGGGSSDAAATLNLLNTISETGLGIPELEKLATQLGSDCAFFIRSIPAMATGKGEILEPFAFPLHGMCLVLVIPPVHSNTALAYRGIRPGEPEEPLKSLLNQPPDQWKDRVINDFEPILFGQYPLLAQIKDTLYRKGALYAAMSGSGSTLFGIFRSEIPAFHFPGCRVLRFRL